jgi:hypothetical protein
MQILPSCNTAGKFLVRSIKHCYEIVLGSVGGAVVVSYDDFPSPLHNISFFESVAGENEIFCRFLKQSCGFIKPMITQITSSTACNITSL